MGAAEVARLKGCIDRLTTRVQAGEAEVQALQLRQREMDQQLTLLMTRAERAGRAASSPASSTNPARPLLAADDRSWDLMANAAAFAFKVERSEIMGPTRRTDITRARFMLWWWASRSGMTLTEIGRRTGERDHTTVLSGVRVVERTLELALASPETLRAMVPPSFLVPVGMVAEETFPSADLPT